MLIISEHAIDRFIERAYPCSRIEAKAKIYSLVIDRYKIMSFKKAYFPLGINNLNAILKDDTIVTISSQQTTCFHKPIRKSKRKYE